ncbi:oxygen-independent coproporphyrinogen III oxidase [Fulvivirga sedimenti]|uniref:Coproporphyrinogen-III oxidase n=1 Tax=Fulvivirga sedimenti TaxID=2879465 RepID=A0A9X1HK36_9BACT|nr:oxygen-independent coproporphyrinogen III oxidase [Fulvivirga sedimenti]MCA6073251.1 oxygen-independent coproporphyrinogen III oxidase [Fulvivirga sedimenti]
MLHLIRKYNKAVPRYTSYPTVPQWKEPQMDLERWKVLLKKSFEKTKSGGISVYIHLPFCEQLCTYCACNKRITKNHSVEEGYLKSVLKELELYIEVFGEKPVIRELHLGGGTPTFFHPENLRFLITEIRKKSVVHDQAEMSFEGHPNNTSREHLETLYELGFRRVSFGIQDLNEVVQRAINRIQPFENILNVTRWAREIGYESVNYDFVYGLPFQNTKNLALTLQTALKLRPDRIAFYSYAHVPWTSAGQRAYDENDLPGDLEKANMYLMGRRMFKDRGYIDIGMDHFALPSDSLTKALNEGLLHRNFMGYTVAPSELLIGLGCSSISDALTAYSQNEKKVEDYERVVNEGNLPVSKGHFLTVAELATRRQILKIACERTLTWSSVSEKQRAQLEEMAEDGIIVLSDNSLKVTDAGLLFLRNVCSVFDKHLNDRQNERTYSKAV